MENAINDTAQENADTNSNGKIIRQGRLKLAQPIKNADSDSVDAIVYNFGRITGSMLMAALGTDTSDNASKLTSRQAFELFMRAVDPADNHGITMMDLRTQLSADDTAIAVLLGNGFFTQMCVQALTRIERL